MIKSIFWNATERRLRAVWRIAITGTCTFVACLVAVIFVYLLLGDDMDALSASTVITFIYVSAGVIMGGWLLDRRDWRSFGLRFSRRWLMDLMFGLALGVVLVAANVIGLLYAGYAERASASTVWMRGELTELPGLPVLVVLFICVGIYEELAFRGYLLKNLAESWNWRRVGAPASVLASMLVTSLLFGVVHATNPNATLISTVNTALAGVLLGIPLLLTGELAMPIGLHITWNLTQSVGFGLPVSGMQFGGGLYAVESVGPAWISGGSYGIEGGVAGSIAIAVGVLLIALWVRVTNRPVRIDQRLGEAPSP
jgi:membrane protease YdiL (CAAX protease family)